VAAFFMGFVGLKIAHEVIDQTKIVTGPAALALLLGLQWGLALIVLWPVARGVPFGVWRRQVGLHVGGGLFKEALCGLGAYLAGLPIVFIALLISSQLMQFFGGGAAGSARHNPVLESVSQGGWLVFLIGTLATIWAPLVEETIFRGSLFRHLRGFLGLFPSAVLSALVFGGAHGYQWFALGPVIALGFNFALIRAWRGSLVGPIVMHALNNATVLLLVFCLFQIMKD
jgi:membrane protease YdiL (CAAX protease family)